MKSNQNGTRIDDDGLLDSGIELLPGDRDSGYADGIALLSDDAPAIQHALDCLAIEVSRYGAPSKCNLLLRD